MWLAAVLICCEKRQEYQGFGLGPVIGLRQGGQKHCRAQGKLPFTHRRRGFPAYRR